MDPMRPDTPSRLIIESPSLAFIFPLELDRERAFWHEKTQTLLQRRLIPRVMDWKAVYTAIEPGKGEFDKGSLANPVTVQMMLDIDLDPSVRNNIAIRTAVKCGYIETVRLLLRDSRVDPTEKDNYALRRASEAGDVDMVRLLLQDPRVNPGDKHNSA